MQYINIIDLLTLTGFIFTILSYNYCNMDKCLFCKIIAGEIPTDKIYENEYVFAFLDILPTTHGHTLVAPKKHYENIHDTPQEIMCEIIAVAKKLSSVIEKAMDAQGTNVYMNNRPAAGQVIFHTHMHIIPRYDNDELKLWRGKPYKGNEKEKIMKKILSGLT